MTPKLDINILDSYNTSILMVADVSQYVVGGVINNPYIEITPPGFQTATIIFSPKSINSFNSYSLNLTGSDCISPLPDGIYKLRYSIAPNYENYVDKSYFKIDQIMEKFDAAFLKSDPNACNGKVDPNYKKKLDEIEFFIQYAVAAANKCNDKLAIDQYKMALKLLNQLNC